MFIADLGKYRAIVISVAMFIFLDLGVLGLNFYISSQIAGDAINVNVAGRQRMLSQKSTKALLDYEVLLARGEQAEAEVAFQELSGAVALFERTLQAFRQGGTTLAPTGDEIYLPAAVTPGGIEAVEKSYVLWEPVKSDFAALVQLHSRGDFQDPALQQAVESLLVSLKGSNLALLKLMNTLTNELEQVAKDKTTTLRMIQTSAIGLAILNFFLILFHFIGQLRRSDEALEVARSETTEILRTVREGLFLLDDKLVIGGQYSQSITEIFGEQALAGTDFPTLIRQLVSDSEIQTAEEYIKLLLNRDVKESLVTSLNPLIDVEVRFPDRHGGVSVKHLSFRFNRTLVEGEIKHILVTVLDVTENVRLRRELEAAGQQEKLDLSVVRKLLSFEHAVLHDFLNSTESALLELNGILKNDDAEAGGFREKLGSTLRIMHKVKGDAGAMELPQLVQAAHQFEQKAVDLQATPQLKGGDFLPLTLALNEMLKMLGELREIGALLESGEKPAMSETVKTVPLRSDLSALEQLAHRIAAEQGKSVHVEVNDEVSESLSREQRGLIADCVMQLVRNAVVHGIEAEEQREASGKAPTGEVAVNMHHTPEGVRVSVRDDGRGLDLEKIRRVALAKGLYTEQQLEGFSRTQLMRLIFEPGFSTADEADEHSGRGVGMDLVRANVNKLRGRVRVANQPQKYCEISFLIPEVVQGSEVKRSKESV